MVVVYVDIDFFDDIMGFFGEVFLLFFIWVGNFVCIMNFFDFFN